MDWVYLELVLVSVAAMLSPTTLTFSVLALVLAERPLRTGFWFYLGAFAVTVAIGVAAAFVIGDSAAPSANGDRKTWVSIFDLVAGVALLVYVARTWRRPFAEKTTKGMVDRMTYLDLRGPQRFALSVPGTPDGLVRELVGDKQAQTCPSS